MSVGRKGSRAVGAGLTLLCLWGCRTQLQPLVKDDRPAAYVGDGSCKVQDFASAAELPGAARNLGWVNVKSTGDDEATQEELVKKVCELGGNAYSQAAWVRGTEDDTPELRANAWVLP